MDPVLPIGDLTQIPFPAPLWLLQVFLIAGFFLHAIPMNLALMGGVIAGICLLLGQFQGNANAERLGKNIANGLPIFTSLAITNGIVPLLFLQVIYGPLIYSSSIIMAAPWLSVLALLMVGYYALYVYAYKRNVFGKWSPWLLIASTFLFMIIGFFFSNNMTLMLTPEKFIDMYQANPNGTNLNLSDPTLIPRFTHFVLAAVAVVGLLMGCFAWYQKRRDPDYSKWLLKTGGSLFLGITLLQVFVGSWFLLSIGEMRPDVMMSFLDFSKNPAAAGPFYLAMAFDVIAFLAMAYAVAKNHMGAFKVSFFSALILIFSMVMTRHNLRELMLAPVYDPTTHPVDTQVGLISVFGATVLIFGIFFIWLGRVVWRGYHPNEANA